MSKRAHVRISGAFGLALLLAAGAGSLGVVQRLTGQGAVPGSLTADQAFLTFWASHRGLVQYDFEGEAAFPDFARVLQRRRSNAAIIRRQRDRFTFPNPDLRDLRTPDCFRLELQDGKLRWEQLPGGFIAAAGRVVNLPLLLVNCDPTSVIVEPAFRGLTESRLPPVELAPGAARAFLLRAVWDRPGDAAGTLSVRVGGEAAETRVLFDVRSLASLEVVLKDETGAPAAARVYLTGADGLAYAPAGSISRVAAMSAEYYFLGDGRFRIDLPAGPVTVEATRGPEYGLVRTSVDLQPGLLTSIDLVLRRWTSLAEQGWYSGDAHIHANYVSSRNQVITPEDMWLIVRAEDLHYANLMVANSDGGYLHDRQYFEGHPHHLGTTDRVLYWNEEFRDLQMYGHLCLLNLKTLVEPVYTGFPQTDHWEHYPPNLVIAEAALAQGGAVSYAHPMRAAGFDGANARELPVDVALGKAVALDVLSNFDEEPALDLWYRLLNCGFKVAISAGTDSFVNVSDHYIPGGGRVYVKLDGGFDHEKWAAGYRSGRSFATNGPVLELRVNGRGPGEEISLPSAGYVAVEATVDTPFALDQFAVVVNGLTVLSRAVSPGRKVELHRRIRLAATSWIAARATGPWDRLVMNDKAVFAHTSPVYVRVPDRPLGSPEEALYFVDWIDRLMQRVDEQGKFATETRKREVLEAFLRARSIYQQLAASGKGRY